MDVNIGIELNTEIQEQVYMMQTLLYIQVWIVMISR